MRNFAYVAAIVLFVLDLAMLRPALAEAKCEPDKVATKYPSLAGKTIKVAQDGEGPPYTYRDPQDFEKLIGLDADLVRATMACIGVKFEFKTGAWSGLL